MGKAHKPGKAHLQQGPAPRAPEKAAAKGAPAHVEHAPVLPHIRDAEIEPLPVRRERKALRVHDIADGLVVFRVAVGFLAVDNGLGIKNAVEKAALDGLRAGGRALLQIAAQADKAVAQGEDRFVLPQIPRGEAVLRDLPCLIREFGRHHFRLISSESRGRAAAFVSSADLL